MKKTDLVREHRAEYDARPDPALVHVSGGKFLAIEGRSEPGAKDFRRRLRALYAAMFGLKTQLKSKGRDFAMPPLEALWWSETHANVSFAPQQSWSWKLLLRVPDSVTFADLQVARDARMEDYEDPALLEDVALEQLFEGDCVQALHVGPWSKEQRTIDRMMYFARHERLAFRGLHHEIYLSDPTRVPPRKLKTIVRHPVRAYLRHG